MNYFETSNTINGINFTIGKYDYFLITNYERISTKLIKDCMRLRLQHVCKTDISDTLNRCFNDDTTRKQFKLLLQFATITKKQLSNGDYYYTIHGKNFTANYSQFEFNNEIIIGKY